MPFQIHLLRLGRIFKPKYDIILYHDFKPVTRLGVVYPLKETVINAKRLKIVSLNVERVHFWVVRGVLLPKWLNPIYTKLYNASLFYPNKLYGSSLLHESFVNGRTVFYGSCFNSNCKNPNKPSPKFRFFRGKYIVRHWLRLKRLKQNEPRSR